MSKAICLFSVVIALFITANSVPAQEGPDSYKAVSANAFPAFAQQVWTMSLDCLTVAAVQCANPDRAAAKKLCSSVRDRLYPPNGGTFTVPEKFRAFYEKVLDPFASRAWSCAGLVLQGTDFEANTLAFTPYWNGTLKQRAGIIFDASQVGIKLVDNSGLESLEKQLAEYADGYPTERSDDPATRVARHVRDDLLSCQREWQEQRSTGKQTNYAHYYTVLCRAYFDAEVLESEPPDGWFRSASMAILATFSAMRQAEKGASLETALMDQLSTAFLARTLAWAG